MCILWFYSICSHFTLSSCIHSSRPTPTRVAPDAVMGYPPADGIQIEDDIISWLVFALVLVWRRPNGK